MSGQKITANIRGVTYSLYAQHDGRMSQWVSPRHSIHDLVEEVLALRDDVADLRAEREKLLAVLKAARCNPHGHDWPHCSISNAVSACGGIETP